MKSLLSLSLLTTVLLTGCGSDSNSSTTTTPTVSTSAASTTTYRISAQRWNYSSGAFKTLTYEYDTAGNITRELNVNNITNSTATQVRSSTETIESLRTYDANNLLSTLVVTERGPSFSSTATELHMFTTTTYTYDTTNNTAVGFEVGKEAGAPSISTETLQITLSSPNRPAQILWSDPSRNYTTINYTYDAQARITEVDGSLHGSLVRYEYAYNNQNRIERIKSSNRSDAIDATMTYSYDSALNLIQSVLVKEGYGVLINERETRYTHATETTTYRYDAQGRVSAVNSTLSIVNDDGTSDESTSSASFEYEAANCLFSEQVHFYQTGFISFTDQREEHQVRYRGEYSPHRTQYCLTGGS